MARDDALSITSWLGRPFFMISTFSIDLTIAKITPNYLLPEELFLPPPPELLPPLREEETAPPDREGLL